jgi:hypothetical protein
MKLIKRPTIGAEIRRSVMQLTAVALILCGLSANAQEPNRLQGGSA